MDIEYWIQLDQQVLRFFNGSDNLMLDGVVMTLTSGLTWVPLYITLLYVVIKNNQTMSQIMLVVGSALLCIVLADGMADFLCKPFVARWRPTNDPVIKYTIDTVNNLRETSYGFFSAHAANTMSIAVFLQFAYEEQTGDHCLGDVVAAELLDPSLLRGALSWRCLGGYRVGSLGGRIGLHALCESVP